jgi:hypothetical protein
MEQQSKTTRILGLHRNASRRSICESIAERLNKQRKDHLLSFGRLAVMSEAALRFGRWTKSARSR